MPSEKYIQKIESYINPMIYTPQTRGGLLLICKDAYDSAIELTEGNIINRVQVIQSMDYQDTIDQLIEKFLDVKIEFDAKGKASVSFDEEGFYVLFIKLLRYIEFYSRGNIKFDIPDTKVYHAID